MSECEEKSMREFGEDANTVLKYTAAGIAGGLTAGVLAGMLMVSFEPDLTTEISKTILGNSVLICTAIGTVAGVVGGGVKVYTDRIKEKYEAEKANLIKKIEHLTKNKESKNELGK